MACAESVSGARNVNSDPTLVKDIVEVLDEPGGCKQRRPVHTVGIGVSGWFDPSDIAPNYCIAEHFTQRRVDVTARFSNGNGMVQPHDGWSDVRGFAVRFHLPDNKATDLIAMTLPVFFAPTPETFYDFALNAKQAPCKRESGWQKILDYLSLSLPMPDPYPGQTERANEGATHFADKTDWAKPSVLAASNIGAPVSYARATYHAVHTFLVTGTDGMERHVRFAWQPVAGVLKTDPRKLPDNEYLQDDIRKRLANAPDRFSLMMTIGEAGDPFNDSTRQWPLHRKRVMMGTLYLDKVAEDQEANGEKLSFNPCRLPDKGIRLSDDPVLIIRRDAYEFSRKRRGGTPCPFSNPAEDK